jgi:hypothetical protein
MRKRSNELGTAIWIKRSLWQAGWAPLLVFGIHVLSVAVFNVYSRFPSFDVPMHFFGGVAMGFFLYRTSINASLMGLIGPYHAVTHRLLVFTSTCTVAVGWEFAEFAHDLSLRGHQQGGLNDTMGDLFFGMAGCAAFILTLSIPVGSANLSRQRNAPSAQIKGLPFVE